MLLNIPKPSFLDAFLNLCVKKSQRNFPFQKPKYGGSRYITRITHYITNYIVRYLHNIYVQVHCKTKPHLNEYLRSWVSSLFLSSSLYVQQYTLCNCGFNNFVAKTRFFLWHHQKKAM